MSADHVGAASRKPIDLAQISRLSHAGKTQHEDGAWMPLLANQSRYRVFDAGAKQGSLYIRGILFVACSPTILVQAT
jgi:hypothetical protein